MENPLLQFVEFSNQRTDIKILWALCSEDFFVQKRGTVDHVVRQKKCSYLRQEITFICISDGQQTLIWGKKIPDQL